MHLMSAQTVLSALTLTSLLVPAAAQTWSSCNPLTQGGCAPNPALGRSVAVDFTSGPSSEFTASGGPTYDSNGAAFTVSRSGDSPSLTSNWYIMFGRVDFVVKAAPGTGIVSAAILQSECLDEIDWEWLGGDNTQAQSNYFGKGITTTGYNRGAFHGAPNNHDEFRTYSIDWTADQIVWSIDGITVRAMTKDQAEPGQYPQTPMYVKLGVWAGGDPSNPQGTVAWAGGYTDYSAGPFTMYVKSVQVTDYSTGSQYTYVGTSGQWESIESTGGQINPRGNGTPVSAGDAPAVTSVVPDSAPLGFGNNANSNSVTATRTGWPWTGTATATVVTAATSLTLQPSEVSSSVSHSASSLTVFTSWDDQGFLTTVTADPALLTAPTSYDSQGFPVIILTTTNPISSEPQTVQATVSPSSAAASLGSGTAAGQTPIPSTTATNAATAGETQASGPAPGAGSSVPGSIVATASTSDSGVSSIAPGSTTSAGTTASTSSDLTGTLTSTAESQSTATTVASLSSQDDGSSTTSSSPSSGTSTSSLSATRSESTLATSAQPSQSSTTTSGTPPAPNGANHIRTVGPSGVLIALVGIFFI